MKLPPRRKPQRSGIERAPRRVWPRHDAFLRRHQCVVGRPDCDNSRIEVAHIRGAAYSGMGLKPASWHAIPLCAECHQLQHRLGQPEFERRFNIDLAALAREFALRSPDRDMIEAMRGGEGG